MPLGEVRETYQVDLIEGGTLRASFTTTTPSLTLTAADLAAVLSSPSAAFTARIAQLSATRGAGLSMEILIDG